MEWLRRTATPVTLAFAFFTTLLLGTFAANRAVAAPAARSTEAADLDSMSRDSATPKPGNPHEIPAGLPPEIFGKAAESCAQACACACPGGKIMPAAAIGDPSLATDGGDPHANPHGRAYGYPAHGNTQDQEDLINYPTPFVERPLVLPEGTTQPEIVGGVFNSITRSDAGVHERLTFAFQHAFAAKAQAGVVFNVAIDPRIQLDSLYGLIQYSLSPLMNARLDAGVRRSACGDNAGAFSGGFGLPFKYKIGEGSSSGLSFAVISGRPSAFAQIDDIVTWDVKSCGTSAVVGLPVGILASFLDIYNINLRTGYKQLLGSGISSGFVPAGMDFAVMVGRQADVGFTVELANPLKNAQGSERAQDYAFERRFFVFGQTRF